MHLKLYVFDVILHKKVIQDNFKVSWNCSKVSNQTIKYGSHEPNNNYKIQTWAGLRKSKYDIIMAPFCLTECSKRYTTSIPRANTEYFSRLNEYDEIKYPSYSLTQAQLSVFVQ